MGRKTKLTARQVEVLRLVAEGLPNKAICRRLGTSYHTVADQLRDLMAWYRVHNRTALAVAAIRGGLDNYPLKEAPPPPLIPPTRFPTEPDKVSTVWPTRFPLSQ